MRPAMWRQKLLGFPWLLISQLWIALLS